MTATTTSQAVQKKEAGGEAMIEQYKGSFEMVLPSHINIDFFVRISQGLLRRDQKLRQAAEQNPGSFLSALLDCARLGLEPGETYHFVPFGREITGIVDYTGEIELIYRAGAVSSVKAEVVYRGDLDDDEKGRPRFEWRPGDMDRPYHNPDWFSDRGEMVGVYAYAVMLDGGTSRVVMMNKADVDRVKAVSKTANRSDSPWKVWEDRMWLKTAVHALEKWVPSSAEYRSAVLRTEANAQVAANQMGVALPVPDYSAPPLPPAGAIDTDGRDGDDQADADGVVDTTSNEDERAQGQLGDTEE